MEEILHILLHSLKHTLVDTIPILPFLFITYFIMELIEHMAGDKTADFIARSGRLGTIFGGLLGALPQCGFSAAVAGLYAGRVITLGTLFATFLSTSDEMLPIMISSKFPARSIIIILATKVFFGILIGFVIDLVMRKRGRASMIARFCEDEGCHCEDEGVFRSSLYHTLKVYFFVFVTGLFFQIIIGLVGEDLLASVILDLPILSNFISALVGLIPNCASSVVITELYLSDLLSAGAMMSGLFVSAGVGSLVLFRTNKKMKENLLILLSLLVIGAVSGIILDYIGFGKLI